MKVVPSKKEYKKEELVITWSAHRCIHAEKCWRGLPEVFQYGKKPWINTDGASIDRIMNQIDQCPSGALAYINNSSNEAKTASKNKISVAKNGPLLIKGSFEIEQNGKVIQEAGNAALCRCGASKQKPYCDLSHKDLAFDH